jgi:hypothetical protein
MAAMQMVNDLQQRKRAGAGHLPIGGDEGMAVRIESVLGAALATEMLIDADHDAPIPRSDVAVQERQR